jgi:hypothetical protein
MHLFKNAQGSVTTAPSNLSVSKETRDSDKDDIDKTILAEPEDSDEEPSRSQGQISQSERETCQRIIDKRTDDDMFDSDTSDDEQHPSYATADTNAIRAEIPAPQPVMSNISRGGTRLPSAYKSLPVTPNATATGTSPPPAPNQPAPVRFHAPKYEPMSPPKGRKLAKPQANRIPAQEENEEPLFDDLYN